MNRERLIQRLVDNELNSDERRNLVDQISADGDWKYVALCFIEKQILDETLSALDGSETVPREHVSANPAPCATPAPSATRPFKSQADPSKRERRPEHWSIKHWSLVASIGIALLFVGALIGRQYVPTPFAGSERPGLVEDAAKKPIEPSPNTLALSDALSRCSTPIPDQFRRDMLSAGYVINEDHDIRKVSLPFGGTIEMPVRNFEVQYLGTSAFQ